MSTTQHTGHYNLPTFGDNPNDRPSWRGDFTDAMTKIDNQMYANATNITTATNTANAATTAAQAAQSAADGAAGTANSALNLAQTNKQGLATQKSYFDALGIDSVQDAQDFKNKAGQSPKIVVFGDSWTQIFSGRLATDIASYMRGELVGNYGVNGAGFEDLGLQISAANGALNATQKDSITHLFLVMGVNTFVNSKPFDNNTATNYCNQLRSMFPNAKCVFLPSSANRSYRSAEFKTWAMIFNACRNFSKDFNLIWTPFFYGMYDSTKYHLTEVGCNVFASCAVSLANGSCSMMGFSWTDGYVNLTVTSESAVTSATISDINVTSQGNEVHLIFTVSGITGASNSSKKRMMIAFTGDQILNTNSLPNQIGIASLTDTTPVPVMYYSRSGTKTIQFDATNERMVVDVAIMLR